MVRRHDGISSEFDFLVFNRVELSLETNVGCPEPDKRARGNERGSKGKTRQARRNRSVADSQIAKEHRALAVDVSLAQGKERGAAHSQEQGRREKERIKKMN
jgi:hypothetical protein